MTDKCDSSIKMQTEASSDVDVEKAPIPVSIDETEKCLSRNASPPHQETTLQEGLLNLTVAQVVMIFFTLTAVTATSAMSVGLVTIGIPKIAEDLQIPQSLILWPGSVYSLASGCCLLLAGSIADMVGSRNINLAGILVIAVFNAVSGGARTGIQFIIFRALQGIGAAMFFPTSIGILTSSVPSGRTRNVGFGCLSLAAPVGLQVGLLLSGVFENTSVTWRFGFYLCAGIGLVCFVLACWFLPQDRRRKEPLTRERLLYGIDWVGIFLSSTCLGLLSYALSEITGSLSSIHRPVNIALLSISGVTAMLFVVWMHHQEKHGRVALVPNSLWRNKGFATICVVVFICWAEANSMDWFFSLFFQQVQGLSPVQAALRFLPNVLFGVVVNIATGLLVHRLPTNIFVVSVSAISTASPLLMAIVNPDVSWWFYVFWAVLIVPTAQDVIYTVANLIIIDTFPEGTHSLAGAVFSTIGMVGTAVGIAVLAVISQSATNESGFEGKSSPEALLLGYRVAFWTNFGLMVFMTLLCAVGLRKVWKVGGKSV